MRKLFISSFLMCLIFNIFSQDNTSDSLVKTQENNYIKKTTPLITDTDYIPQEDLKELPLIFQMGGSIFAKSRIYFEKFQLIDPYGFEPVPNDKWHADVTLKIWAKMTFKNDCFLYLGIRTLFLFEHNPYQYLQGTTNNIVPMFNIDNFYLHWNYGIGKVIVGRTFFNLKNAMIFSGPLDGIQLNIDVPFLNFKTFLGYSGLLGIFNPWFNPYSVTSIDRSYFEESNLTRGIMVLKFNSDQARRLFLGLDFDIHFFGQHVNPYFLLQYDFSSLFYGLNTSNAVHTFHLGINFEGRIIQNFYYKVALTGLFGMHPSSVDGVSKSIIACALQTQLRYTITEAGYSTFIIGYSLGTGNKESFGTWSNYASDSIKGFWSDKYDGDYQKKFYYYGKFDGGYVLDPILSNIHSIMFKYTVSPYNKNNTQWSLYLGFYQTLKMWSTGPISDDGALLDAYPVGSEIDLGTYIKAGNHFNFGFDFGFLIPETAYYDINLRFKMGATMGVTF